LLSLFCSGLLSKVTLILVLYFSYIFYSNSLGREIFDLEFQSDELYDEAAAWVLSSEGFIKTSTENGNYLFGDFEGNPRASKITRTYETSVSHSGASITFDLYFLGKWSEGDQMSFRVVGENYSFSKMIGFADLPSSKYVKFCSPTCKYENILTFSVTIQTQHTDTSLKLEIEAETQGSSTKYFGIRNVKILLSSTLNAEEFCLTASPAGQTFQDSCVCPFGSFLDGVSVTCKSCASKCETCIGSDNDCLSCNNGFSYDGSMCKECDGSCKTCDPSNPTTCLSCPPNAYLYRSGQCLLSCEDPFVSRTIGFYNFCDPPCNGTSYYTSSGCIPICPYPAVSDTDLNGTMTCKSGCENPKRSHFYPTGNCGASCSPPFEERILYVQKYCDCNNPNFLYWNGSCLPSCPFPLKSRINNSNLYCDFPCMEEASYLAWNGSCVANCFSPTSLEWSESNKLYCNTTCKAPHYLFDNETCSETCPGPYYEETIQDVILCHKPCPDIDHYYFENGTCLPDCSPPWISNDTFSYKICSPPELEPEPEPEPIPEPKPKPKPIPEPEPELQPELEAPSVDEYPTLTHEEVKEVQGLVDVGNSAATVSSVGLTRRPRRNNCWYACKNA